jgi:hypothetical protein
MSTHYSGSLLAGQVATALVMAHAHAAAKSHPEWERSSLQQAQSKFKELQAQMALVDERLAELEPKPVEHPADPPAQPAGLEPDAEAAAEPVAETQQPA